MDYVAEEATLEEEVIPWVYGGSTGRRCDAADSGYS